MTWDGKVSVKSAGAVIGSVVALLTILGFFVGPILANEGDKASMKSDIAVVKQQVGDFEKRFDKIDRQLESIARQVK